MTACDLCIYLTRQKGISLLYPYDASNLTREEYVAFSRAMKRYLRQFSLAEFAGINGILGMSERAESSAYLRNLELDGERLDIRMLGFLAIGKQMTGEVRAS